MKTLAIASIVGAVILYIYLALAHVVLPIHDTDFKYTPAQDNILAVLNASNLEEGFYFVPYLPPGSTREEKMKHGEAMMGKPERIPHPRRHPPRRGVGFYT